MKTMKEIAADCGLDDLQVDQLGITLRKEWAETDNRENALIEIIGALYRRIETLESANLQMSRNTRWLIGMIDQIHLQLCADKMSTWQGRAENAVRAAKLIKGPAIPGKP